LALHVSIANTSTFFYFVAVGFNITITTYVGVEIGEFKVNAAKKYALMGCIVLMLIYLVE
jgi:Na+-driven multidrug efflux pump